MKKAVVDFYTYPLLSTGRLVINYPGSVELGGGIDLNSSSGEVWSYDRALNVYKHNTTIRIDPYATSPYYKYKYTT